MDRTQFHLLSALAHLEQAQESLEEDRIGTANIEEATYLVSETTVDWYE